MDLYKVLGYKGALPFIALTALLFLVDGHSAEIALAQLAYASMILSFLAGVHWSHGLPRNNHKQVFLAMQPTIGAMFLFVMAIVTNGYGVILLLMAAGFPLVYMMDKKLLEATWLPDGYFDFRRKITILVTICLVLSAASFFV